MAIEFKDKEIQNIVYNGKNVGRVFYNGKEVEIKYQTRFRNDQSRIGQTQLKFQCGIGEAQVNAYTGRLLFTHTDIVVGAGNFQFGVTHIYNNKWVEGSNILDTSFVGNGWKLNVQQYCYAYVHNDSEEQQGYNEGDYIYIDSDGNKHRFISYKELDGISYYYDETGSNLILKVISETKWEIEDKTGNIIVFDGNGRAVSIISGKNADRYIEKKIIYDGEKISSMYDVRKSNRKLDFSYNAKGFLEKIDCYDNNELKKTLNYIYDLHNNLTTITTTMGDSTKFVASFKYSGNRLQFAIDRKDNSSLEISYITKSTNSYQVSCVKSGVAEIEEITGIIEIPTDNIRTFSKFEYESNQTLVTNEKGTTFVYQFNNKGFTTATFEKIGSAYKTLFKKCGWSLSSDSNTNNQINSHNSFSISNNIYEFNDNSIRKFCNIFNKHDNGEESNYAYMENYVLSFWVKLNVATYNDIRAKLKITNDTNCLNFETFIDKTAYNVWQYVTIPIDFQVSEAVESGENNYSNNFIVNTVPSLKTTIRNMSLIFDGAPSNSNIEVCDMQIAIGSSSNNIIDDVRFEYANKIYYTSRGKKFENNINSNFFMTDKDILLTYQNMFRQVSYTCKTFDLVLCNGTKTIAVESVSFSRQFENNEHMLEIISGKPNYYIESKNRSSINRWYVTESQCYFYSDHFEQRTSVDVLKKYHDHIEENNKSKNYISYYYNGLEKENKDAYGVITKNIYDTYGNLTSIEIYNEADPSVKQTKSFLFDASIQSAKLREIAEQVTDNKITSKETFNSPFFQQNTATILKGDSTFYTKKNTYDSFEEKLTCVTAEIDSKEIARNNLSYDAKERLTELSDTLAHHYKFDYDIFGNVTSYKMLNANNIATELLNREYVYDDKDHNYSVIEKYSSNNTLYTKKSLFDKYNRLSSIQENGYYIEFSYQSIDESPSLAKVSSILDPYTNQKYYFNYDLENRPYGYVLVKSNNKRDQGLSIRQIEQNKTQYTFYDGKDESIRTSEAIFEDAEVDSGDKIYINPRLRRTIDSGDGASDEDYNFFYDYDQIGRLIKQSDCNRDFIYEYTYNDYNKISFIDFSYLNSNLYLRLKYSYDGRGNLTAIDERYSAPEISVLNENYKLNNNMSFSYDSMDRISSESNSRLNLNREYIYNDGKLSLIKNNGLPEKNFIYDGNGNLCDCNTNIEYCNFSYDSYGNVIAIKKVSSVINEFKLQWERGNLLSKYGDNSYFYNYNGVRFKKAVDKITKFYYLDGKKILGEDWSDGTKIRYFYDAFGIAGIIFNDKIYHYIRDSIGNIRGIVRDCDVVCLYDYDSFGHCQITQIVDDENIGIINPFRWKSHYYDDETELYYIDGRYYDPISGIYLNADNPNRLLQNATIINGLDRHAATIDNLITKEVNQASIFTSKKYYPDPNYYPSEGKSWWDIHWREAIMRITACVLLVVALVLLCIPGTSAVGANMLYMGFKFAISGMVVGGIMSGIIAAITGNDFWDAVQQGMIDGFVSGFSMGAIVGFFSALPCVCGNCFKAGTLVLTETGHKKIEDIKVGDKVWAYDEKTKTNKLKKVVRLFRNKTKKWFHIFINKQEIVCTGEHPFYINNKGWVKARDLIENDEVIHYNEDVSKINKIYKEILDTPEDTYNFEVEDCHTYYVTDNDVLVHNACAVGAGAPNTGKPEFDVMEFDSKAVEIAKEGNPSFQTFKNRLFKYHQDLHQNTFDKIISGKNPIINGQKIIVHHPYGRVGENLYNVVGVTQQQHYAIHAIIGYRNAQWFEVVYNLGKGIF